MGYSGNSPIFIFTKKREDTHMAGAFLHQTSVACTYQDCSHHSGSSSHSEMKKIIKSQIGLSLVSYQNLEDRLVYIFTVENALNNSFKRLHKHHHGMQSYYR